MRSAVLSPEKEKSAESAAMRARGNGYRTGSPFFASRSMTTPPG